MPPRNKTDEAVHRRIEGHRAEVEGRTARKGYRLQADDAWGAYEQFGRKIRQPAGDSDAQILGRGGGLLGKSGHGGTQRGLSVGGNHGGGTSYLRGGNPRHSGQRRRPV